MTSATPPGIVGLLAAAVRADPSRPFLTFYDDATGERLELSVATTANWAAKASNLLVDEFGVAPGEQVALDVPPHWHTAVLILAVGSVGARVAPRGTTGLRVAAWAEGTPLPDADDVLGLSLRPMNGGLTRAYPGVIDVATETLAYGDSFDPPPGVLPGVDSEVMPIAQRVLSTTLDPLVGVLAGGGSLVLVRRADPAALPHRAAVERVEATVGCDVEGLPRLG